MGVFTRGSKLWLRYKGPDGKWVNAASGYPVGREDLARRALKAAKERVAAGVEYVGHRKAPLTVREFFDKWKVQRRQLVADALSDEGRLRIHVLPKLGAQPLDEVRPRHLVKLFRDIRASRKLASKSVHNVYGVLSALFRDATYEGLVDSDPCTLDQSVLGEIVDARAGWREGAVYTREELATLVFDHQVPADRRVMYALQGVAGLRHGEAAGLRWRHYDAAAPVLGKLAVVTSYDKGRTKTNVARYMPVHPALAAVLAEWKLHGWAEAMGRQPRADDLVVPVTKEPKRKGRVRAFGSMRDDGYSWKRLAKDLETLGFRHRRGHDLRRTFISLARSDGASKDILRRGTHKPSKEVIEGYTTFEWDVLCREVAKLQLSRPTSGRLLSLPTGAAMTEPYDPRYSLVTGAPQATEAPVENAWRRRESNPLAEGASASVGVGQSPSSLGEEGSSARTAAVETRRDGRRCNDVTKRPYRPPTVVSKRVWGGR